ncbi:Uncharacterized protein TCAP_03824 [Tolypocladium capitatum]|uniref:Uncharacterized protein n=1 Tax=Tolypocladium capitatum TaxID=45235 RepID=A0A2K3QFE1_9HYPO|nr:Uncharacterized protein TCAP_03824 [Tolypocladium capitatum]
MDAQFGNRADSIVLFACCTGQLAHLQSHTVSTHLKRWNDLEGSRSAHSLLTPWPLAGPRAKGWFDTLPTPIWPRLLGPWDIKESCCLPLRSKTHIDSIATPSNIAPLQVKCSWLEDFSHLHSTPAGDPALYSQATPWCQHGRPRWRRRHDQSEFPERPSEVHGSALLKLRGCQPVDPEWQSKVQVSELVLGRIRHMSRIRLVSSASSTSGNNQSPEAEPRQTSGRHREGGGCVGRYLRFLAEQSTKPLCVRHVPSGVADVADGIDTSTATNERSNAAEKVEIRVRQTPVFYARFLRHAHDFEGISSELTENETTRPAVDVSSGAGFSHDQYAASKHGCDRPLGRCRTV